MPRREPQSIESVKRNPNVPDPDDLFFELDDDGNWCVELWFIQPVNGEVGLFRDKRGEVFEQRYDRLQRAGFAKPGADDLNDEAERRRYRDRSRKTAQQRRAVKATAKQINYINVLGRQCRMSLDDLRAYSPTHSLRELDVGQASALINWLKGSGKEPVSYPPPRKAMNRRSG